VGGACNIIKNWSKDEEKIERWKTGKTGQPLVDANMRELLYTGRLSSRGVGYDVSIELWYCTTHMLYLLRFSFSFISMYV